MKIILVGRMPSSNSQSLHASQRSRLLVAHVEAGLKSFDRSMAEEINRILTDAISNAKLVLTDSGGIQEETTILGTPYVTLKQTTERPVTITHSTNVLAGTTKEAILHHAFSQLEHPSRPKTPRFWNGRAGERIINVSTCQMK